MSGEGKDPAVQRPPKPSGDVEQVGTLTRLPENRQYSLGFGSLRIGRQRRADLVITDKTVSRHHADICYESGRYVLYDHSTNGTWINGTLVAVAQPLRNGDTIKFGKIEFRFSLKTVPAEEAARVGEETAPSRISRSSTLIMKGGKGKRRTLRNVVQVLILLVLLLVLASVVLYFFFPELAARVIERTPGPLRGLLGSGP